MKIDCGIDTRKNTFFKKCKGCDGKGHSDYGYWKLHHKKHPKYFHKKKKVPIIVDIEEMVDNALYLEGMVNHTNLYKGVALVVCIHK